MIRGWYTVGEDKCCEGTHMMGMDTIVSGDAGKTILRLDHGGEKIAGDRGDIALGHRRLAQQLKVSVPDGIGVVVKPLGEPVGRGWCDIVPGAGGSADGPAKGPQATVKLLGQPRPQAPQVGRRGIKAGNSAQYPPITGKFHLAKKILHIGDSAASRPGRHARIIKAVGMLVGILIQSINALIIFGFQKFTVKTFIVG